MPAQRAFGHSECRQIRVAEIGIPIGPNLRTHAAMTGLSDSSRPCMSARLLTSPQSRQIDAMDAAVQFHDLLAARALMQAVHVLRDEQLDTTVAREIDQPAMRSVGGARHERKAAQASRSVPPTPVRIGHEVLVLNRAPLTPATVRVTVSGNARIGRTACALVSNHEGRSC